ncbi:MAG: HtrA protease/chaperone protein [Myxococcaceae bacterium]|nr:HtrA protease/chaperone protein [Myxococcaceae bacterium]MEA2751347.1 serine protease Do [Myxococcales bacterium]
MKPRIPAAASKIAVAGLLGVLAVGAATTHSSAAPQAVTPTDPAHAAPIVAGPALDTAALVAKVKSSVVSIMVEQAPRKGFDDGMNMSPFEFFGRNGPRQPAPELRKGHALGSGFVFDDKGHVLTNAHVVDGAEKVRVKLSDERELDAKVKGRDERLDIAVLELIGAKDLPYATLGSSGNIQVGEPVVAIGNPFGLGHTVTSGIVSAKGRAIGAGPYDDFLQTDASINPGNSGGPLFDARGNVVGMNTAINPNGQGIGFAIPSDEIREVLPQLVTSGHVSRGRLGVRIQDVDVKLASAMNLGGVQGALVDDVEKGGPAEKAGFAAGDVIIRAGSTDIVHARDLTRAVARQAPGAKVDLVVRRGTKAVTLPVTLGKLEDEKDSKQAPGAPNDATPQSSSGLGLQVGDAEGGGALVRRIAPDGAAAGSLEPGDVIVEANHQPVKNANDLKNKAMQAGTDKPLLLRVTREGSTRYVAIERSK